MALFISPNGTITASQVSGSKPFVGGNVGDYFPATTAPASSPAPVASTPAATGLVYTSTGQLVSPDDPNYNAYKAQNNPAPVNQTDKSWVNQHYQKYFDRDATSAELANWSASTPAALDQFLAKEQKTYGYVSKDAGAENKARYDSAMAQIDASDLPPDIKALWKQVVGMYPNSTDFNTGEIMNTFNKIKTSTIDPYYKELADVALKDVQTSVDQVNQARASELEAQKANEAGAIKSAQAGLESSGMTFSGKGVEQLGTGSAYAQQPSAQAPVATSFAGIDPQMLNGAVGQNNRLISTSTAAKYKADQQSIGRKAEDFLGTSALSNVNGLNYTPAGVNLTGSNTVAKETKTAGTLQDIIGQWRSKQENAKNV
jgi:hypothetical protein